MTEPFKNLRHVGLIMGADRTKMSKSKGNVVNPDEIVKEFGADAVRVYLMFLGPFDGSQPWDPKGILGIDRFLARVWKYAEDARQAPAATTGALPSPALPLLHKTIKKVGEDIEQFKFNTALSALMVLLNGLEAVPALTKKDLESFIKLLHPFVPHLAQELWERMGNTTYVDFEPWPTYDPALIKDETITIIVQVNGKVRDTVTADAADQTADAAQALALGTPKVKNILNGQTPKKVIYVDKKLVNIVL